MYKCGKNVTCNFGEVFFMKEYCIESKRVLTVSNIVSLPTKCTINDVFTLYLCISFWCTPCTEIKTSAEESFIKVERSREIQFCDMCTTNFRVARWFELYLCIVSQDTQMLITGLTFLQTFICKHLTRSLANYLFLYIGATSFLLKQNIWFK